MMPRRRKQTSSTNTTPSTNFHVAQIKPHGRADERTEQGPCPANRGLHHELPRRIEHEGIGRHEALHDAEQPAGEAGIGGGDHESGQLVAVNVVADGRRADRIVADGAQDCADRRAHDAHRDHQADEVPEREEDIHLPVAIEIDCHKSEVVARRRNAGQPVLAAGIGRQRIELDEEEHFRDRDGDHRKIDAGAAQCDQPDEEADDRGRDRPDDDRR
jgi:hypothetical protein